MRSALAFAVACALGAPAGAEALDDAVLKIELARQYDGALLERAAAAPDAADRRLAARAAGRLKDPRAVPWLLRLTEDPAGPVRRTALSALGQIAAPASVVPLRAALARLDRTDLPFALEALGKTRDARATSEVARHLRHEDADVRGAAALALFRLGDVEALPDVFAALAHEPDAEARWRAVYAAWRLLRERARRDERPVAVPPDQAAALLAAAGPDRPFAERVFALRALGHVDGKRGAVEDFLTDPDPRLVIEALAATATPFDEGVARRAAALAKHDDPLVRAAAVEHVAAGGAGAAPLLLELLEPLAAKDPELHGRVRVALAAAGQESEPLAEGSDALLEETLWRVAAELPARIPEAAPRTVRGQVAAAEACGKEKLPAERALPLLLELLQSPDFTVRSTAVASLGARGARERAGAIVAAARASRGAAFLDVRVEAANALAALGVADPWLTEATGDPDAPVRAAARAALEKLGRPVPPATPAGFRLDGRDAAGIREAARELRGARLVLETTKGTIVARLHPDDAPAHCVSLATLAGRGFYDGLTWHRVVNDFVIQGGCPRGDGWGGPGYALPDEIGQRPYVRGTVGMPKGPDDTGGCQIFITHIATPHLDGRYTVFAQVVEGFDVVDRIRVGDRITRARVETEPER
jgi:cyclophilin family peptidyl-prolyl cis-trans isomerase